MYLVRWTQRQSYPIGWGVIGLQVLCQGVREVDLADSFHCHCGGVVGLQIYWAGLPSKAHLEDHLEDR